MTLPASLSLPAPPAASLAARQAALLARFAAPPDPRDRLELILRDSSLVPILPPEERHPALLVPGCQSRVWLAVSWPGGICAPRAASDSAIAGALARLVCAAAAGVSAAEIAAAPIAIIEQLGLDRILSPTRLNGLAAIRARLRQLAIQHLSNAPAAQPRT